MRKPKPRNEAALKRKGEKRNARAKTRRARNASLVLLPLKESRKREQKVSDRMAPRRTEKKVKPKTKKV